jgi:hypothetical protein
MPNDLELSTGSAAIVAIRYAISAGTAQDLIRTRLGRLGPKGQALETEKSRIRQAKPLEGALLSPKRMITFEAEAGRRRLEGVAPRAFLEIPK